MYCKKNGCHGRQDYLIDIVIAASPWGHIFRIDGLDI